MSSHRVVLRSVLGILLASSIVPVAASAAPDWAPAVTFPVPGSAFHGQDAVAYQNGGVATEAFLEVPSLSPLRTVLHLGALTPGGSYTDQFTLPSVEGAIPTGAQIAVAPDGAAVATWVEFIEANTETSPYRYRAAYRPAGNAAWEAPFTIATDTERNKEIYAYLVPVIGADGTAAVGVQHIASGEKGSGKGQAIYRDDVTVHHPGGGWLASARVSPTGESGEDLTLNIDGQGDLTAAFALRFSEGATPAQGRTTAIVRRLPAASSVWGPEENITGSEITHSVYTLHLGEDEAGDAVLSFQYGEVTKPFNVWAVTRQGPDGSWTTPTQLVTGGSAPEDAGVAPDGVVYIVYSFQGSNSGESCEGVLRGPAGGTFTVQRCLSPTNEEGSSGSVAFLGNDAYFAWKGSVPGEQSNATIQGARWPDASTLPEVARNLDVAGVPYGNSMLILDHQGSVVALYTNQAGQLRAAAYDAGPPILLSTGVPASATVGAPVTFSAAFVDLWSGLGSGQPTWSFGDGTPAASGASVTHTFSAPGAYTVTLRSADALGNTTDNTYTVAVAPSPPPPSTVDTQAPTVTLTTPKCPHKLSKKTCKRLLGSRKAWQTLIGTVTDPAPSSGIASVQVAVYLTHGKRIEGLVGKRFRKTTKAKSA